MSTNSENTSSSDSTTRPVFYEQLMAMAITQLFLDGVSVEEALAQLDSWPDLPSAT